MKVMSGLSDQSHFMLVMLVALFILPCSTIKSIQVWTVNFIVILPMDRKKPCIVFLAGLSSEF